MVNDNIKILNRLKAKYLIINYFVLLNILAISKVYKLIQLEIQIFNFNNRVISQ